MIISAPGVQVDLEIIVNFAEKAVSPNFGAKSVGVRRLMARYMLELLLEAHSIAE